MPNWAAIEARGWTKWATAAVDDAELAAWEAVDVKTELEMTVVDATDLDPPGQETTVLDGVVNDLERVRRGPPAGGKVAFELPPPVDEAVEAAALKQAPP